MPRAPKSPDPHRFDDLFAEFGPIAVRRFFGGEGVFSGDVMIGLVFDDRIYFKTDETTRPAYVAEHCEPFTFEKGGETVVTGYYSLPERLYDEPEELAKWARAAHDVVSRSPTVEKKRKKQSRDMKARRSRSSK